MNKMKLWFSLFDRKDYNGNEPSFFDTSKIEFTKIIEENYEVIKNELQEYLKINELQSYFNSSMVEVKDSWQTISLKTWNVQLYQNHKYFPETLKLINSVDGLVSASFNLLAPKGIIKPHCGDTNGIYRCHLGLEIPDAVPVCGFRVKEEWQSWENGKLLVFVDALKHEAINLSNKNRFIFLFDVVRPEYITKKNYICSVVMSSLFLQKRAEYLTFIYKVPFWVQLTLGYSLVPFAFCAIKTRNFLYKFFQK